MYDDDGRVSRTITASPYTPEDRALMLARQAVHASRCPGCGHPKATAWHPDNEGWFEEHLRVTCHACTAMAEPGPDGTTKPVEYLSVADTRDYGARPLPVLLPDPMPGPQGGDRP